MSARNVFVVVGGRITYTEIIKQAVLNPKIRNLILTVNGGWDYLEQGYRFIKLLIERGQVDSITTHNDLLANDDYLKAMQFSETNHSYSIEVNFEYKKSSLRHAYASKQRMNKAIAKYNKFTGGT